MTDPDRIPKEVIDDALAIIHRLLLTLPTDRVKVQPHAEEFAERVQES